LPVPQRAQTQALYLRRMSARKLFLLGTAALLIVSVFFPWAIIQSKNLVVSGMHAESINYGKPGIFILFCVALVFLFSLIPRIWAFIICIISAVLNFGWMVRSIKMCSCSGGECPQWQPFFYVYLASSILLLVAVLMQEVRLPPAKPETD
jgi:hypothetical protein